MDFTMSLLRKKALQFIVKSAIGRFLKEVEQHNVVDPRMSSTGWGLSFGLESLEVNEDRINQELLQNSPLRLAFGTINSIRGDISFTAGEMRKLEVEGIDLTFDFKKQNIATAEPEGPRPRASAAPAPAHHHDPMSASDPMRASSGSAMFSSLLAGEMSKEAIEREILDDMEQQQSEHAAIDEGVSALSATIKSLVHSLSFSVSNINIRFRVAPSGSEIVPGEPLPPGTVELLVSLQREVSISDDSGDPSALYGNSFSKIIQFSGIRVSLYDALTKDVVTENGVQRQTLSFSDIICSGSVENVENQITLHFSDTDPRSMRAPQWETVIVINEFHAILSPTQLLRLGTLAQRFVAVPGASDNAGKAREEVAQDHSRFKFACKAMSLSVTQNDAPAVVAGCWRDYETVRIHDSLRIPHYAFRIDDFRFLMCTSTLPTKPTDDKYHQVFDKYGGRYVSCGLLALQVLEWRAGVPMTALVALGDQRNVARGASRGGWQAVAVMRTTCPITPSMARACGVEVPPLQTRAVARQDTVLMLHTPLYITVDVEVLDRLIAFGKRVESLTLSRFRDQDEAARAGAQPAGNQSTSEADSATTSRGQSVDSWHSCNSAQSNSPERGPSHPPHDPMAFDVLSTASVTMNLVRARVLFPVARQPAKDLYGPLTLRLFDGIARGSGPHLRKALDISFSAIRIELPTGDASSIEVFAAETSTGASAAIACVDLVSKQSVELAAAHFGRSRGPHRQPVRQRPSIVVLNRGEAAVPRVATSFTPKAADPRETVEASERAVLEQATVAIYANVDSVRASLHQDDLLLILFMSGEVAECVSQALRRLDPAGMEELERRARETMDEAPDLTPLAAAPFGVALKITIEDAHVGLWAPRLTPSGGAAGEPLWMVTQPQYREEHPESHIYHNYGLEASRLTVFVYNYTPVTTDPLECTMVVHVRSNTIDLTEQLCSPAVVPQPPVHVDDPSVPMWGSAISLLRSYAGLYNRSHHVRNPPPRHALTAAIRREMNHRRADTSVDLVVDRLSVMHQCAHEGDHWLMVLLAFVADAPLPALKNDAPSSDDSDGESMCDSSSSGHSQRSLLGNVTPLVANTTINVVANNTLIQYAPFGNRCRLVALAPYIRVCTERPITSVERRVELKIGFEDVSIFIHDNFIDDLITFDDHQGAQSVFGKAQKGLANDLEALNFVSVLEVGHTVAEPAMPVIIRIFETPDKPLVAILQSLRVHGGLACNSFWLLQTIINHYIGAIDCQFLPSPIELAGGIAPVHQRSTEPTIEIAVPNLKDRISLLLTEKIAALADKDGGLDDESGDIEHVSMTLEELHRRNAAQRRNAARHVTDVSVGDEVFCMIDETPTKTFTWTVNPAVADMLRCGVAPADVLDFAQRDRSAPSPASMARSKVFPSGGGGGAASPPPVSEVAVQNHYEHPFSAFAFSEERHFSRKNVQLFNRTGTNGGVNGSAGDGPSASLPTAAEIIVNNCRADIRLFGGIDFSNISANREVVETLYQFHRSAAVLHHQRDDDDDDEWVDVQSLARNLNEELEIRLHGISARVQVFQPNCSRTMQLTLKVRDGEVLDRIHNSTVRTLLMCAIADQHRDDDASLLELHWASILPKTAPNVLPRPEEQLSVRLLPLVVTMHRRAIDLLSDFLSPPPNPMVAEPDAAASPLYFNRLHIHPVAATINVCFEVQDFGKALHGEVYELCNLLPSPEGSHVVLPPITVTSCSADEIAPRLIDVLTRDLNKFDAALMLLSGLQPVRSITEAGEAVRELVMKPLDHYRRNRSLHAGIAKGIKNFSTRMAGESLRVAANVTRGAHAVTRTGVGSVLPATRALPWGSQPAGAADGVARGVQEAQHGALVAADIVRLSLVDGDASPLSLALVPVAMLDGVFRGFTEVLVGLRNSVQPQARTLDQRLYK